MLIKVTRFIFEFNFILNSCIRIKYSEKEMVKLGERERASEKIE